MRSARTRRSTRSARGRLTERAVGDFCFCCGLVRSGKERVCRRDDSVKHTTSPPHRENVRRVIRSQVFQSQSAATEQKHARPLPPPLPQSVVFNTSTSSAFPFVAVVVSPRISPVESAPGATPGNLDTEHPSPYCYGLPTQLRLESVANAHTAADLHVRSWVSNRAGQESHGRRERVRNTPRVISDNP